MRDLAHPVASGLDPIDSDEGYEMDKSNYNFKSFLLGVIVALVPVLFTTAINNYFENQRLQMALSSSKENLVEERLYKERIRIYSEFITEVHKNMAIEQGGTWGLLVKSMELRLVANSEIINISQDIMCSIRADKKDSDYYQRMMSLTDKLTMLMRKDLGLSGDGVLSLSKTSD